LAAINLLDLACLSVQLATKKGIFSMLSMKFYRRHLSAVFVFAVVFVSLVAARAFATTISISTPSQEKIGTGPVTGRITLKTQNTIGEARSEDGKHLLRAWRADDNTNNVWMALDGGSAFQINPGTTRTFFSPTVTTTNDRFIVFHTGDDGNIYAAAVSSTNAADTSGTWEKITLPAGHLADGPIDAVEVPGSPSRVVLVYHVDDGRDDLFYTVITDSGSTAFKSIAGGAGLSSPSIAFDPANNKIVAVLQGEDSRLWKSTYDPDTDTWDFWTSNGETCKGRPTIAVNQAGTIMIARPNGSIFWAAFNFPFSQISEWEDGNSPFSRTDARLVSDGTNFFLTFTNNDHTALFAPFTFH
jgi:hypothetical protein